MVQKMAPATHRKFIIYVYSFLMQFLYEMTTFSCREECTSKGGTNGGTCASGFGVCCICKWNQLWNLNVTVLKV